MPFVSTELTPVEIATPGTIATLPILVLHVHSRCNCRCVMCDIWKRTENIEIRRSDIEVHRQSLRQLRVQWIVVSGGEPLLNKDLQSLCGFFREENIRLTLLTSGLLLQRRARDVCEGFDDIIISLDGPRDVHDRIRGVNGAFQMIAEGIQAIRRRRPQMPIRARCTLQKANHNRVIETVKAAKELSLNSISFLAADLTSEAFNRLPVWPADRQANVALNGDELSVLEAEVEHLISTCSNDISSGFIAESPEKLRRIVDHFRAHWSRTETRSPICNAPWVSAVIEADGTVRPCFFHQPIGNIREGSLAAVVNGHSARQFRQRLDVENNQICQGCVCSINYKPS